MSAGSLLAQAFCEMYLTQIASPKTSHELLINEFSITHKTSYKESVRWSVFFKTRLFDKIQEEQKSTMVLKKPIFFTGCHGFILDLLSF